jgi:hypothetical protein
VTFTIVNAIAQLAFLTTAVVLTAVVLRRYPD